MKKKIFYSFSLISSVFAFSQLDDILHNFRQKGEKKAFKNGVTKIGTSLYGDLLSLLPLFKIKNTGFVFFVG